MMSGVGEKLRYEKGIALVVKHARRDAFEDCVIAGFQHSDFDGHDLFR